MGGGEGSTAREVLRHKDIEKVVMCDIDRVYYTHLSGQILTHNCYNIFKDLASMWVDRVKTRCG